jgi:hypothetical protein
MNRRPTSRRPTGRHPTGRRPTDRRPTDRRLTNHRPTNRRASRHCSAFRRPRSHRRRSHHPTSRRQIGHRPIGHRPKNRRRWSRRRTDLRRTGHPTGRQIGRRPRTGRHWIAPRSARRSASGYSCRHRKNHPTSAGCCTRRCPRPIRSRSDFAVMAVDDSYVTSTCADRRQSVQSRSRCTLVTGPDGEVHYKPRRGDVPRTLHNARVNARPSIALTAGRSW